jgi:hypothetical protein
MVALPAPPAPVAVTLSVPDSGITDGAVYNPAAVTDPYVAAHFVIFAPVNCCVAPSVTVAVAGDTVILASSVIVAVLVPPAPVAVTVSVPVAVIVAGAV